MDRYRDRMDVTAYRGREVCCTLYIADEMNARKAQYICRSACFGN